MTSLTQELTRTWDDALVPRVAAGEHDAWRRFHRHHYPMAVAFLRKLGVRDEDMEDACQEVFLQAHRYLPRFRGEAGVKTWFYRLCATEAGNVRRRGRMARALMGVFRRNPVEASVPAATCSDRTALALVAKAMDEMNEGERLVFVLFEMEGLCGKEIAEIAGCPEATVWRRLHYARQIFRRALGVGAD